MPRGPRLAEAAGGVRLPRGVSGVGGALLTELLRDKKKKKSRHTPAPVVRSLRASLWAAEAPRTPRFRQPGGAVGCSAPEWLRCGQLAGPVRLRKGEISPVSPLPSPCYQPEGSAASQRLSSEPASRAGVKSCSRPAAQGGPCAETPLCC